MDDLKFGILIGAFIMSVCILTTNFICPEMGTVSLTLYALAACVLGSLIPTKG